MISRNDLVKHTGIVLFILVSSLIGRFVLQIQAAGITLWLGVIALWLCAVMLYSRENRGAIGDVHKYVLVYAIDPERFKVSRNRVTLEAKQLKNYKNPNNDPNGPWQSISMTAQGWRPNQMYTITAPNGKKHTPPEGRCWSMIEFEYLKLRSKGRLWWGKDGNGVPREIRYLSDVPGLVPWTWWPHEEVGHTDEAKKGRSKSRCWKKC